MSELKRWTDEGAPHAIERLLQAAESEEPSATSVANTLARLGVVAGVTSGAATSGAAISGAAGSSALSGTAAAGKLSALALTASLAKWIALGSAVGGVALTVYTVTGDEPAATPARSAVAQAAPRPLPTAAYQHPSTSSAQALPSAASLAGGTEAPARAASSFTARTPAPQRPLGSDAEGKREAERGRKAERAGDGTPDAIPAETLAAEIAGIDRARSLLGAGRFTAAIVALDDYERRFPRQHFAPEVLYLRMEAALGAGRVDDARQLARRLLAVYPTSPQSEKAKYLLDRKIE